METQKAMAAKVWALGALSFWPIVGLMLFILALLALPRDDGATWIWMTLLFTSVLARPLMALVWTIHLFVRNNHTESLHKVAWLIGFWFFVPMLFLPVYWYKHVYQAYQDERMRLAFAA